ncbi:18502_t:CDS:10 [Funneliformis geosporum]|nr:18502_t:CDS:10 [Funneliformis geosporum]
MKRKNNYAPQLPEEKINQIVQELSDPNLSPTCQYTEEELLLQILEKKLDKGLIKAEFKQGKFLLSSKGTDIVIKIYDQNKKPNSDYPLVAKDLPENPDAKDKLKFDICQAIINYKQKKKLTVEELAKRIDLDIDPAVESHRENTGELIDYAEQLFLSLELKVNFDSKPKIIQAKVNNKAIEPLPEPASLWNKEVYYFETTYRGIKKANEVDKKPNPCQKCGSLKQDKEKVFQNVWQGNEINEVHAGYLYYCKKCVDSKLGFRIHTEGKGDRWLSGELGKEENKKLLTIIQKNDKDAFRKFITEKLIELVEREKETRANRSELDQKERKLKNILNTLETVKYEVNELIEEKAVEKEKSKFKADAKKEEERLNKIVENKERKGKFIDKNNPLEEVFKDMDERIKRVGEKGECYFLCGKILKEQKKMLVGKATHIRCCLECEKEKLNSQIVELATVDLDTRDLYSEIERRKSLHKKEVKEYCPFKKAIVSEIKVCPNCEEPEDLEICDECQREFCMECLGLYHGSEYLFCQNCFNRKSKEEKTIMKGKKKGTIQLEKYKDDRCPLTLNQIQEAVNNREFGRLYRSPKIEKKYRQNKEEIISKLKEKLENKKDPQQRWVLRKNDYPYYLEKGLEH